MQDEAELVKVAAFAFPGEAHLAQGLLDSAGIDSCLANNYALAAGGNVTNWLGEFRLMVAAGMRSWRARDWRRK